MNTRIRMCGAEFFFYPKMSLGVITWGPPSQPRYLFRHYLNGFSNPRHQKDWLPMAKTTHSLERELSGAFSADFDAANCVGQPAAPECNARLLGLNPGEDPQNSVTKGPI